MHLKLFTFKKFNFVTSSGSPGTGQLDGASVEYFLEQNYIVLFFYHLSSTLHYRRHIKNIFDESESSQNYNLDQYHKYKNSLLLIPLQTVTDYSNDLQQLCCLLKPFSRSALIYAYAAVSDYYIPNDELTGHKIQSDQNESIIQLKPVPRLSDSLKGECTTHVFVVSFNLEKDENIGEEKCLQSVVKYNQYIIIGNTLKTQGGDIVL